MKLVTQSGAVAGKELPLDKPIILLGRGAGCDILLQDQQASRRHAEIRLSDTQISITDLGSMNGTFVNGARIQGTQVLRPGDVVRIGLSEFVLQEGTALVSGAPMAPRGQTRTEPPPVAQKTKSNLGLILGCVGLLVILAIIAVIAFVVLRSRANQTTTVSATGTPMTTKSTPVARQETLAPTPSTPTPVGPTATSSLVEQFVTLTPKPVTPTVADSSAGGGGAPGQPAGTPSAVPFRVSWSPGRYEGWAEGRRMSSDLTIQNISLPQIAPPYAPYFIISDSKGNMRVGELRDYSSDTNRQPALSPGQQVMWTWFAVMTNQEWVRGSVFRYAGYAWAQEFNPDGSLNGAPRVIDEKQLIPFLPKQVPPEMLATMAAGGMPTGVPTGIPTGVPTGVPTAKP
jgi:pSer/pThr/pTyr-binding forkhead associated (FHA) protein